MDDKSYETEFFNLVMGLQGTAWMLLGKVMNPMTGKIEKNLDAAKATIETLKMLQDKTRGNLTEGEDALLKIAIQQLEVNFVEAVNSKEQEPSQAESREPEATKEEPKPEDSPGQTPSPDGATEEKETEDNKTNKEKPQKEQKSSKKSSKKPKKAPK